MFRSLLKRRSPQLPVSDAEQRFSDRDPAIRIALLRELPFPTVQSWCLKALRDPIEAVRNIALERLQTEGNAEVAPEMAALNYRNIKCQQTVKLPDCGCSHMAMTEGALAATGRDDRLYLWVDGQAVVAKTPDHQVRSLTWSLDGQTLFTGGVEGKICLWNRSGQLQQVWPSQGAWVSKLAIDQRGLVSADRSGNIQCWSPEGRCLQTLSTEGLPINGLTLGGDRILATNTQTLYRWDRTTGCSLSASPAKDPLNTLAHHPTQPFCVTGDRFSKLTLWDMTTGESFDNLYNWSDRPTQALAWSPDGEVIFQTCASGVNVWYWRRAWFVYTLVGHRWAVTDLAVSQDGKTIATLSEDKTIKLWSL
jgi:WD40 repeat protein